MEDGLGELASTQAQVLGSLREQRVTIAVCGGDAWRVHRCLWSVVTLTPPLHVTRYFFLSLGGGIDWGGAVSMASLGTPGRAPCCRSGAVCRVCSWMLGCWWNGLLWL